MILRSPAVPGQTAQFEMTHPPGAAGNVYSFLASLPPYAPTTQITVPGLTVQGLARVNPQSFSIPWSGVLGPTGSVVHGLAVPNDPSYLGLAFDLQGMDWSPASSTLSFADNDITVDVRSRQWQSATIVGTGSLTGQPQIAVHPQGTAVALWILGTTGLTVQASTYRPGSGWSTPVPLSGNGSATEPAMAMDPAGNVVAVWTEANSIWSSRLDAALATWSAPVLLETGFGEAGYPQVAVDAAGNAIAVWWQLDGLFSSTVSLVANHYTAGLGWGGSVAIENLSQGSGEPPQLACDAAGNATAVWRWSYVGGNGPVSTVWTNRFTPGSGWGTAGPVTTDVDVNGTVPPEVAVDENGDAIAIWETMGTPYREIHAARRTGGGAGTWGPTVRLDPAATLMSDNPKVAMTGSGNAFAVWSEHDGTRANVMFSRFDVGAGWSPAAIAATDASTWCRYPELAVDGLGDVVITWQRGHPGIFHTCWSSRLAGGVWSTPIQIDGNNHSGVVGVALGADASGNAIAVVEVYGSGPTRTLMGNTYR